MAWITHALVFVLLSAATLVSASVFSSATAATGDGVDVKAIETSHANGAELEWTKYTGPSGAAFDKYEVHRSTTAGFAPSASTLLTTIRDASRTSYRDTTAAPSQTFSYKVVANTSPSLEQRVTLPAAGKGRKVLQPAPQDGKATYIEKASSGTVSCTNAGGKAKLLAGASTWVDRSLVQFELQDLPAGATVSSAALTLYRDVAAPKAATVDVHRAKSEWVEGKSTSTCTGSGTSWDETEGGVGWNAKGGDFDPTPGASVALTAGQAAGDDTFNVAPIVQEWANGKSPNHGFVLKTRDETPTAGNAVSYTSDDEPISTSRRPKLVVEYAEKSPSKGPGVKISRPERDDLVKGTVNVDAEAGDDRRVEKVEFLVDGVAVGSDTAEPWSVPWNTTTATNAAHTLTAKATDDVGNVTTSPSVAVTVGNSAAPTAKVMSPSNAYADVVKGYGAHAHWRLGETTGTTVADASGRGNTGTLTGAYLLGQTSLITGDANPATTFQNATTDGRLAAGPTVAGSSSVNMSVEAWVDFTNTSTVNEQFTTIASRNWGAPGGWRLAVYKRFDGSPGAAFQFNDAGTVKGTTTNVPAGKLHLVGRHTGSSVGLFVNGAYTYGVAVGTQAINTANSVLVGGDVHENLRTDEVALYNKAMTTDEASVHYDVGMGRTPKIAATHTFSAAASDDRGVTKVNFYVDGARFAYDTSSPYSATLDTLDPSEATFDGPRQITTRSFDADGNETDSAAQTVEVANTVGTPYKADVAATTEAPAEVTYNPSATTQQKSGIAVTVKNTSSATWTAADYVIRPRWATPEPVPTYVEGAEVPLGTDLAPGATKSANVLVEPPALPEGVERAQYKLQVDVYRKSQTTFFADKGNKPFEKPITVKRQSTSDDLGLERFYHYEGENLGGGMQHLANVGTGNSLVRFTPASSAGRGLATVLDLTYNSLEKKSESPVGNNWSLGISGLTRFGNPIDIHPNKADEIAGNANRYVDFTDGDGTTHRFVGKQAADGTVYWEEPAGVHLYMRTTGSTDPARKWAITRPDRTTYFFDADGYPTVVEDANANKITFTLEATPPGEDPGGPKKRITAVTDAGGRQYKIVYYAKADSNKPQIRGKIRKIVDHSGMEVTFQYYEDGNLLRIAQSGGTRSDGSNLSSRAWYFTYTTPNGEGPAIPLKADRMYPDAKTPSQSTRLFSVRDPRLNETTFEYAGVGAGQSRWKLTSRTNRSSQKTAYAYDETTRVTTATAPLDRVTKYTFDAQGQVTKITNPKNEDTSVEWTPDRHVQKVTQPKTATTTTFKEYAYNQNGQLTDTWDELRNRTQLTYENLAADGNDVAGKWKTGRTVAHVSRLKTKTNPRGLAASSTAPDDHQWVYGYDTRDNVTSVSDPEDKVTTYTYNLDGTVATSTDALQRVTKFPAYDPSGQPTEIVDAKNQTTRFGYDVDGYLRWVQDANHADDTGAEPRDFRTYFDYDTWHRMGRQSAPVSTKNKRGELIWTFADFDDNDNVYLKMAPQYGRQYSGTGAKTMVDFDPMDRQSLVTGPDKEADTAGERWKYDYDAAGRLREVTDPRGMQTATIADDGTSGYDYDKLDRVVQSFQREVEGGAVTRTLRTHSCFDEAGNLRAMVPPKADVATVDCSNLAALPRATRVDYDDAGRPVTQTDALGHKTETRYDENGDVRSTTDAQGQESTVERDQRGLAVKSIEPFDGGTTPRKLTTKLEYDAVGNLVRQVSPRGWDASSDKTTFGQYTTRFEYDAADQMVKQLLPTSTDTPAQLYEHRAYDANGNLTTTALPDPAADIATVPAEKKTQMSYFDPGWIETSADRVKPKVRFEYTAEGQQRLRTPDKPASEGGGPNLSRQREWVYYADGMLQEERVGSGDANSAKNTFVYDANNNMVSAENGTGISTEDSATKQKPIEVAATYDSLSRATKVRQRKKDEATWSATSMTYDLNGNLATRVDDREEDTAGVQTKAGRRHEFTYDVLDRAEKHLDLGTSDAVSDDRRVTTGFLPTGWEREVVVEHADSAGVFKEKQRTQSEYFLNGLPRTKTIKNGDGVVKETHDLSYVDAAGRYANGHRTTDTFRRVGPKETAPCRTAACTTTFSYDARERLTQEKTDRDVGADPTTNYTLDSAGNVRTEERINAQDGTWTKKADFDGDRLVSETFSGAKVGTLKYFYDSLGNRKCITTEQGSGDICNPAGGTTPSPNLVVDYAFDTFDRLASSRTYEGSVKKDSAKYTYDPFDRPVEQTEDHASFATPRTTLLKYVGLSTDVVSEEQREGSATGKLNETKRYSYDAEGRRTGMTSTNATGDKREFTYGRDATSNVSMLMDETGKAQASYGYTAYGESDEAMTEERDAWSTTGAKTTDKNPLNPYRYTDKRLDTGSNTLDMGARRFGPGTGQFLQEDQYKDALGDLGLSTDPLTQNRYALAGGNPVSFMEIDGHEPASSYTDRRNANYYYSRRKRRTSGTQYSERAASNSRPVYQQRVSNSWQAASGRRVQQSVSATRRAQHTNNVINVAKQTINIAGDAADGAADKAEKLKDTTRKAAYREANNAFQEARRMANIDLTRNLRHIERSARPFGRMTGPAGITAVGVLDFVQNRRQGQSIPEAGIRAGLSTGAGMVGASGGALLAGTGAGLVTVNPFVAIGAAAAGGAAGGVGGGKAGDWAGDKIFGPEDE